MPLLRSCSCSLLRTPELLHQCVSAMSAAAKRAGGVLSVKMRSGYLDTSLLDENLLAVQEGVSGSHW